MLARLVGRIQGFPSRDIFLVLALLALVSVMNGCTGLTSPKPQAQTPTPTPSPSALSVTTTSLAPGQTGQQYSLTLAATGGTPSYTWSISLGTLPTGLALGAASGQISGTPTASGQSSFTVAVKDSASSPQTASKALTLVISSSTALDQYGGLGGAACSGGGTGYFRLAKLSNNRWMFCDPSGNVFWNVSMYNQQCGTMGGKYANAGLCSQEEDARLQSWKFNALDAYMDVRMLPIATYGTGPGVSSNQYMPFWFFTSPNGYALRNANRYATESTKDIVFGVTTNAMNGSEYRGWLPDFYAPTYAQTVNGTVGSASSSTGMVQEFGLNALSTTPWAIGWVIDDADQWYGVAGGGDPNCLTATQGVVYPHPGWMVAVNAPIEHFYVYTNDGSYHLFNDGTNYSKQAWANYLQTKYGTIGALNTAWGTSGFYTSFGSTGTSFTGLTLSTSNGLTFTGTLPNTPVAPFSLAIKANGVLVAGDCPYAQFTGYIQCNDGNADGTGGVAGVGINGIITYASGAITITFAVAPTQPVTVDYVQCGFTCGTGILDEDGRNASWMGSWQNPTGGAAADEDAFLQQFTGKGISTITTAIRNVDKNHLIFGPTSFNKFGCIARQPVYTAAAQYLDGMVISLDMWNYANNPSVMQKTYDEFGKPFVVWTSVQATPDSSTSGADYGIKQFTTQAARAAQYTSYVNGLWTTKGTNGDSPVVGLAWWDFTDMGDGNWGIVSFKDNAYDGLEDLTGNQACSPEAVQSGYSCGNEAANHGDFVTGLRQANQIWYSVRSSVP